VRVEENCAKQNAAKSIVVRCKKKLSKQRQRGKRERGQGSDRKKLNYEDFFNRVER
jgi:hypothetical protein